MMIMIFAVFCMVFGVSLAACPKAQLLYILMKGRSYKDEAKIPYLNQLVAVLRVLGGLLALTGLYIGIVQGCSMIAG